MTCKRRKKGGKTEEGGDPFKTTSHPKESDGNKGLSAYNQENGDVPG